MADLSQLSSLSTVFGNSNSVLEMEINKVHEDPNNVRQTYDEKSLTDFSEVLKTCGMSTPISVRKHPDIAGCYIINNGHRRFRAAQLAQLKTVPILISEKHNSLLQLSDNLVREDMSLLDVAKAIQSILETEEINKENLAKALSKSSTWLSKVLKLLQMPNKVKFYYELGRLKDLDAIYQLCVNYKNFGIEIDKWLEKYKESSDLITQADVKKLLQPLKEKKQEKKQKDTNIYPECLSVKDTTNTSMEEVADQSTNTPMEKVADQSTNTPMEKVADQSINTPMEEVADQSINTPMEEVADQSTNTPMEEVADQSTNTPMEEVADQSTNTPMEEVADQSTNTPMEKVADVKTTVKLALELNTSNSEEIEKIITSLIKGLEINQQLLSIKRI